MEILKSTNGNKTCFAIMPDVHPSDEEGMKRQAECFEELTKNSVFANVPFYTLGDETVKR